MTTRFRFVGDHGAEHCGCEAVRSVIRHTLSEHGVIVGLKDPFDVLLVNGEGSMHHGKRNFLYKMDQIRTAQDLGKPTYLINSVWQDNPSHFDDCLARLDDLWTRGVASSHDLQRRHAIAARHYIDLSYFAPVDEMAPRLDLRNKTVVTDVYAEGFGFVWLSAEKTGGWTNFDMRRHCWSTMVTSLRTARILVTGRHHGMYAACRARIPFVPIRGNSHKIEDLLETARSPIPVANSVADAGNLVNWALANRKVYDDLYAWMDEQPCWTFDSSLKVGTSTHVYSLPDKALHERANEAIFKRDFDEAYPLWQHLLEDRGEKLPYPRNACMAFFASNDVATGMLVTARTRLTKPGSIIFAKLLMQYARHQTIWIERNPVANWWSQIREAAYQASIGETEKFHALANGGLTEAGSENGAVFKSSVNFFLACKLVQLNLHELAFDLRQRHRADDAPDWILDQEDILLNELCRKVSPAARHRARQPAVHRLDDHEGGVEDDADQEGAAEVGRRVAVPMLPMIMIVVMPVAMRVSRFHARYS